MTRIATLSVFLAAWLVYGPAIAQTVKCIDKTGKVTYTNMKCSDLGLKDGGEVPDHLNSNPAYQPTEQIETRPSSPSRPPAVETPKPAPAGEARKPAPAAEAPKQDDPAPSSKRRCFKTAGGYRCNDAGTDAGTDAQ